MLVRCEFFSSSLADGDFDLLGFPGEEEGLRFLPAAFMMLSRVKLLARRPERVRVGVVLLVIFMVE